MTNWSADKIICVGMVIVCFISVLGYYLCMWAGLNPTIEPTISIITGLFGVIGVSTGKSLAENKTAETLEKAKKAVGTVEAIKDVTQ